MIFIIIMMLAIGIAIWPIFRRDNRNISEQSLKTCLEIYEKRVDIYDALQKRLFAGEPNSDKLILSRDAIKKKFSIPSLS